MPFVHSIHSLHMRVINTLTEAWSNFLNHAACVFKHKSAAFPLERATDSFADKNNYLLSALTGIKNFMTTLLHLLRSVICLFFLRLRIEPYFASMVTSILRTRIAMDIQLRYARPVFCLFQVPIECLFGQLFK
jgi:hypothetical protein